MGIPAAGIHCYALTWCGPLTVMIYLSCHRGWSMSHWYTIATSDLKRTSWWGPCFWQSQRRALTKSIMVWAGDVVPVYHGVQGKFTCAVVINKSKFDGPGFGIAWMGVLYMLGSKSSLNASEYLPALISTSCCSLKNSALALFFGWWWDISKSTKTFLPFWDFSALFCLLKSWQALTS